MKVFLSWSGLRSKLAAEAFYHWLPDVLQSVKPWMSSEEICSGAGWNQEIRTALNESNFGIIFVTRDNRDSVWLMFEAGAIAKHVADARVVPLLVDDALKPEMLTGPLAQLQAREATREKILRLMRDINFLSGTKLSDDRLERCFGANWDRLDSAMKNLPTPEGPQPEIRSEDMLAQILRLLRSENRVQSRSDDESRINPRDSKALKRLYLRLDEIEASLALRDRIVRYWETVDEDAGEVFVDLRDGNVTYRVFKNGDLRMDDVIPF